MVRLWHDAYPPGVPREIDPARYRNLNVVIERACQQHADRPAFQNFGSRIDFREFQTLSASFASWLQHDQELKPGERVALMMPNMLAYPVVLAGVLRAGGVVVNTNPQYTARELAHQLRDSGARIIVVFEGVLPVVAEALNKLHQLQVVVARLGDFMPWHKALLLNRIARRKAGAAIPRIDGSINLIQAIENAGNLKPSTVDIDGDDLAFLQYTGGTTGKAKGAMLSHRNIVANILQVNAWYEAQTEPGKEIIVTALPLYHIYALTANCLAFLCHGGLNVLISDPRNMKTFVKTMKREPFTAFTGVNTLFSALLDQPGFSDVDFSRLKLSSGGGMAVQTDVAERWRKVTGKTISEGYGLTEASPVVAANLPDQDEFSGTIGLPVPSTEVSIRSDDGNEVEIGGIGELCVRGPQVMQGYWNQPQETANVLDANHWLRTGDIATMDENGFLTIVDRKKDLIIVSGFNVYPNEIEDIAVSHPDIAEAAAIGVPDKVSGETLRLVVVARKPNLDERAVIDWCRQYLTGYKIPRSIVITSELPKSAIGKILRRAVREKYGETTPA